eukprot:TRINITY_DN4984_c0_g1_i4.p1 TRINITY_DN4984_c0_g1~~TRINITY_DN4984_c0_g1_i4.p1  ORF type:complete len:227 (-),score=35.72 TRINITY_DN4984_c0_g1_i4:176-820(-)
MSSVRLVVRRSSCAGSSFAVVFRLADRCGVYLCFFFNDTATTEIYTRSIVGSVRCVQETGYQRRVHGELGKVQIQWIGSLGEKNTFYTKTVSVPYSKEPFTIKLINTPQQITVEEPRTITLQIFNFSANSYRLKLYIKEEETKTIAINAVSHQEISRVNPFENFTIQMLAYPKHSGIQRLTGLHAIDLIRKRDLNFGVLAEFLVLGHKALESSH